MTLHVLLIGIDAYKGARLLNGCVHDIDAVQQTLLDRLKVPKPQIRRLASPRSSQQHSDAVPSAPATLANIRRALAQLAADPVGPTDRVFIYYSGHGTQVTVEDPHSGRQYPREALLPEDTLDPKHPLDPRYLVDWELNAALAKIAARCHSVSVMLDCCCSAGATRGEPDGGAARFHRVKQVMKLPAALPPEAGARGVAEAVMRHHDNCQVIAACQADELARELPDKNGKLMGNLTRAFCDQLKRVDDKALAELRWARIWRALEREVNARARTQHPWLSGGFGRRVFGGDRGAAADMGHGIVARDGGYEIDAGVRASMTEGTLIAVYGDKPLVFPTLGSDEDLAARRAMLVVKQATANTAYAVPAQKGALAELPEGARARVICRGKRARLRVALQPQDDVLEQALCASPFLKVVGADSDWELRLDKTPAGWRLVDDYHDAHEEPRFPAIPLADPVAAREVAEHYERYHLPLRLAAGCLDLPKTLQVALLDCSGVALSPQNAQTIDLPEVAASEDAGRYEVGHGARLCVAIHNAWSRPLYVTLINVAASGRVLKLGHSEIPGTHWQRFWLKNQIGAPFEIFLPKGGGVVGLDLLVAIGTTREGVDLGWMQIKRSFADVLARLAKPAGYRDFGGAAPEQWTSAIVAMRVV